MIDLEIVGVSKRYWLPQPVVSASWRRRAWSRIWPSRTPFLALDDVSFTVERGEALGIIGSNGAGKSTLLKLLSEITAPTAGEIRLHGRLSALIEVGSGFHPELTGRENIFLSGSILGMRRAEIVAKLDQIIEFADIGDFIDAPVKWYSSGMYVRLGFAIAAHLDPQILLVDEALAVGDEAFQHKCFERILALRASGKTIVFISHDLQSVEHLCDRVILMRHGRIALDGPAAQVVSAYRRSVAAGPAAAVDAMPARQPLVVTSIACSGRDGAISTGHPLTVRVAYEAFEPVDDVILEVWYCTEGGRIVQCEQTTADAGATLALDRGSGGFEFHSQALGLQAGTYTVVARARKRDGPVLHVCDAGEPLVVQPDVPTRGHFFMPYTWRSWRASLPAATTPIHTPCALVSVVIPCFNQAHYLRGALDSVRAQGWPAIETIVVDDGSIDDTHAAATALGATIVVRQTNHGLSHARNAGLAASHGEYVLFLDADDELLPDAVGSGVAALAQDRHAGVVGRRCQLMDGEGRPLSTTPPVLESDDLYAELLGTNFVWTPGAAVFRRDAIESIGGFPEQHGAAGDYAVLLTLARRGKMLIDPRDVVRYRKHGRNMSRDAILMLRAVLAALKREHRLMSPRHREALIAGRRRWQRFYGEQLTRTLRHEWRTSRRSAVLISGALFLCRHCPREAVAHLCRKISRVVRRLPPELDADSFAA